MISLIPTVKGSQDITVGIGQDQYRFSIMWLDSASAYFLDIADDRGNAVVSGLAMAEGADLLGQHRHLGLGIGLFLDGTPAYAGLGDTVNLYVVQ